MHTLPSRALFMICAALSLAIPVNVSAQGNCLPCATFPFTPHCGTSPYCPTPKTDQAFVVDTGPGLDTQCLSRRDGPIVLQIPIDRFVGKVDPTTGLLSDPIELAENGVVGKNALLQIIAYDVDSSGTAPDLGGGSPTLQPERDSVTFNGVYTPGFLVGSNNGWSVTGFSIPIRLLRFPVDPGPGGTIIPAINEIRIDIDTANRRDRWCTRVDWAVLAFTAAPPVVLVHGLLGNPGNLAYWTSRLTNLLIPNYAIDVGGGLGSSDSIYSNSWEIAATVNALKRQWGVQQVNIMGYSKGGRDAREYAFWFPESVRTLIQVGAPNLGSELADLLVAAGIGATAGSFCLFDPVNCELTTWQSAAYSFTRFCRAPTNYVSLAGHYEAASIFCDLEGVAGNVLIGGPAAPDDSVVGVYSAHGIPCPSPGRLSNLTYFSACDWNNYEVSQQAKHGKLNTSPDVFNMLLGRLESSSMPAPMAPTVSTELPVRSKTVTGTIAQGKTNSHSLSVAPDGAMVISLLYSRGNLDMTLVSPSGSIIDPSSAPSLQGVLFGAQEDEESEFKTEVYRFETPEAGVWTVKVRGTVVQAGGPTEGVESYGVTIWFPESTLRLQGRLDRDFYKSGIPIRVEGVLTNNGSPLTGALVGAEIHRPDGGVESLVMKDDGTGGDKLGGDGVYTCLYGQAARGGFYSIALTANGPLGPLPSFSRESLLGVSVSETKSSFAGTFADRAIDTDGDGLFDELDIDVPVNLDSPIGYTVLGVLSDVLGKTIDQAVVHLQGSVGQVTAELKFDGQQIYRARRDGPFEISLLQLSEDDDAAPRPLEELQSPYSTPSYSYRQFQHEHVLLPGSGSDVGVDLNGNGLYDQLRISLRVDLLGPGSYEWSGRLVDSRGFGLDYFAGAGVLAAGESDLVFSFSGRAIGSNGVNGPYRLTDVAIAGSGGSVVASDAYSTQAYESSKFESFPGGGTSTEPKNRR